MFRMAVTGRTTRALAAGALIFSLTATTFVGSANAAPVAHNQACSVASQVKTDAIHALHDGWKASTSDLKALASDARELRHELNSAWRDLKDVLKQAVEDLRDLRIGRACNDEDDATSTTDGGSTDTSALDQKVKDIVDNAIKDMQAVVEAARQTVADAAAAAETEATDGTDVDNDEDADEDADEDNDEDDGARDNSREKSKAKSSDFVKLTNFGRGQSGKGNGHRHGRD